MRISWHLLSCIPVQFQSGYPGRSKRPLQDGGRPDGGLEAPVVPLVGVHAAQLCSGMKSILLADAFPPLHTASIHVKR